ncbi:MAG: response regulator [Candidatus Daviesbacteria bacterium]|nr:response regulator [Candidatus Daviesbacteria bacterium]
MKRILIVEDDQFLREFYQELLEAEGYILDTASEGETGLRKIQQNEYDLILLDIMLPKLNGIQILSQLKTQRAKNAKAPIVVLTNLGQDVTIKQCFDLGAAGYLIKSALNPDEVLNEVKSYLQKTT